MRAKELERAQRAAKVARKREKQLSRVGNLLAEIKKEDASLKRRQEKEATIAAARPKKLGPRRHAPRRPDVLLTEEQPGALRQLATEGSLLVDRFDSMQARNLIEVRDKRPTRARKGRHKSVPRESSKGTRYKSPFYKGELPAWM